MSEESLEPPRRLRRDDDREAFKGGASELDDWFQPMHLVLPMKEIRRSLRNPAP